MPNKNYQRGRGFEYRVMNMFKKASWPYVHRHYASKGIADIVAIRKYYDLFAGAEIPQVCYIQCKFEKTETDHKKEKKELIKFANKSLGIPIWATSDNKHILLMNLLNNRRFFP